MGEEGAPESKPGGMSSILVGGCKFTIAGCDSKSDYLYLVGELGVTSDIWYLGVLCPDASIIVSIPICG